MGGSLLDLRSDTLTKPTAAMREAMMRAEVGDAYYDEDPSVRALEEGVAAAFGMEAAVFMPSGTMSNQVGLRLHARAGDAVLCSPENHIVQYETGALAGINGLQHMPVPLEADGVRVVEGALEEHVVRPEARHAPTTALVAVENTHLRAGGAVYPIDRLRTLKAECARLGLPLHIDGARIWHAARVEGIPLARYGAVCDTLSVCFSKGLGAPVGSALLGSRARMDAAKKVRKMMGGSMRQCGFLAEAARHAMECHYERLDEDHEGARLLARYLTKAYPAARIPTPATNLVIARFPDAASARACLEAMAASKGLRLSALDARTVRGVVHLDVPLAELRTRLG